MACIIRIDKHDKKRGISHTHGWQVRGRGTRKNGERKYHSKLFSDGVHGGKGKALIAAQEYLQAIACSPVFDRPVSEPNHPPYHYHLNKNNQTGIIGVHRTRTRYTRGRVRYPNWVATYTGIDGTQQKKSYSVNCYGEDEAKRLAVEFREMWEVAVKDSPEAVKQFLQEMKDGYLQ